MGLRRSGIKGSRYGLEFRRRVQKARAQPNLLRASIRFMQTDSLFRKPSENQGSETQQRPRFVSAKMDVPNILIFGTLFCRDPRGIRKVDR
jgi:hypothetical protein